MPNYKETSVAGTSWQRTVRVVVENPLGGVPSIAFVEEEVLQRADGRVIHEPVANIHAAFTTGNPLHVQAYTVLNAIYEEERAKRDLAQTTGVEVTNG